MINAHTQKADFSPAIPPKEIKEVSCFSCKSVLGKWYVSHEAAKYRKGVEPKEIRHKVRCPLCSGQSLIYKSKNAVLFINDERFVPVNIEYDDYNYDYFLAVKGK